MANWIEEGAGHGRGPGGERFCAYGMLLALPVALGGIAAITAVANGDGRLQMGEALAAALTIVAVALLVAVDLWRWSRWYRRRQGMS